MEQVAPLFDELEGSVVIVGGFMTTIWVHARPAQVPAARATVDLDVGVDRKALRIGGDRTVVGPALKSLGFKQRPEDEPHRYAKELSQGQFFVVDLVIAEGASRHDPPLLETGVPSLAAPGLAYALKRKSVGLQVEFSDGDALASYVLPLPPLDAALVLKGALVGTRTRPDKLRSDTVDAALLAALCVNDTDAVGNLVTNRTHSEVKSAVRFLDSCKDPDSREARRVEAHFVEEQNIDGMGEWAAQVADRLLMAISK